MEEGADVVLAPEDECGSFDVCQKTAVIIGQQAAQALSPLLPAISRKTQQEPDSDCSPALKELGAYWVLETRWTDSLEGCRYCSDLMSHQ